MPTRYTLRTVALLTVGAVVVTAGAADARGRTGPNGIANNAIRSRHIQNGQVRAPDIRNGAVTSAKIRNGQVRNPDLANNSVTSPKIRDGQVTNPDLASSSVTSGNIRNGTIQPGDLSTAARQSLTTTYAGPNWGIIDRSVAGDGDSYLRAGPSAAAGGNSTAPPRGVGSLGMRVGATTDKAAFGNQVDFSGTPIHGISTLSYWVFTNSATSPNLQFEINPNLASSPATFTTLTFENPAVPANVWTKVDPTTGAGWGLTGDAGTATGCQQTPVSARCTWAQVQTALANDNNGTPAAIFTVKMNLGAGAAATSAAVDALQINNQVFDFEPFGVSVVAP